MKEIEHKFLVDAGKWASMVKPKPNLIVQGFLSRSVECTVRVRIKETKGFLTIKGKTEGISRTEFEYEISLADAESMISSFTDKHIRKDRYEIKHKGHLWEIDVFHGALEGLILAELEVSSEDEQFELPDWVTEDVSRDPSYYNAVLIDQC